jgi:uncharacterized membrane protein YccC
MVAGASQGEPVPQQGPVAKWELSLVNAVRTSYPALLFGVRLWAAVSLALYVAFWLELDNAYWAGTSAALVCQPHLGASLRKGWFRMIGTLIGAVAIVVLTAWFPQERFGFLVGLALWGGACALVATLLHNFAAYAAALAGFTAAIVASDQLGATGGPTGQAFMLAVIRVSEIWIGIVCAGIVLALTDFGTAPRRLAAQFAALSADIAGGFAAALTLAGSASFDTQQPIRRELVRRVIALDPVVDESLGESSRLRYHSPVLQAAIAGLFATLAAWRTLATPLARLGKDVARHDADVVLDSIPQELRSGAELGKAPWIANPSRMRRACEVGIQRLTTMPASTVSLRLLADQCAHLLAGFAAVLDGLALLVADPVQARPSSPRIRLYVPDWLPALINGARAFATIVAVEVFWIATAWPNSALAITFAAIVVILMAPRADEAYAGSVAFMVGTGVATVGAAITLFAALPNVETFAGFSMVLATYLVPAGALLTQPWNTVAFAAMVANFVPSLAPANQMSYDTIQFYNAALAIVAGCGAAALAFRLLPPLSPSFRAQRLLELTLHDLRRLATTVLPRLSESWEGRTLSRLVVVPDSAAPVQRAQLLAAVSVGTEVIHLRHVVPELGLGSELDDALEALAQGNSAEAIAAFGRLDDRLTSLADLDPPTSSTLHERASILLICDALVQHRTYFDTGVAG